MNQIVSLMAKLAEKDIRLWLEDDNLRFSAPEGAMTPDLIAELREHKPAIIQFLQQSEYKTAAAIEPVDRTQVLRCSSAQQRLWFLHKLNPNDNAYHIHAALKLRGGLDLSLFDRACSEILMRHEVLRTSYTQQQGEVIQVIHPAWEWKTVVEPLSTVQMDTALAAEITQPFDLSTPYVLRTRLWRLQDQEYLFAFTVHHIAADGWSLGLFVSELMACYQALASTQTPLLVPLTVQYADYAAWQQQESFQRQIRQQLEYWQKQLAGVPVIDLPLKKARHPQDSHQGAQLDLWLDANTTQDLNQLCQQQGVTLFMALITTFAITLQRFNQQDDFCIGTPVAGRSHSQLEPLIGCFLNLLALRFELNAEASFCQLLAQSKAMITQAFANQDVPFEHVVAHLDVERDLAVSPVFQVMFALQNAPFRATDLNGLQVEPVEMPEQAAQFDLKLNASERDGRIHLCFDYREALLEADIVEQIAQTFVRLLQLMLRAPGQAIADFPLLAVDQQQQQLAEIYGRSRVFAGVEAGTAIQRFQQQAQQRPEAIALLQDAESISYGDLDRRANQLARYLIGQGVGSSDAVAILLPRGVQQVVAMLAVAKLGAMYVPLDDRHPAERIAFILDDAKVDHLLTVSGSVQALGHYAGQAYQLDQLSLDTLSDQSPVLNLAADAPCYLIYTSGTTGKPKGCVVTQNNLARLLDSTDEDFAFSADDTWLYFHSFAFDFSVWEIWGALSHGARLVICDYEAARDTAAVYQLLQKHRVSVLNQTPSAFSQLIAYDGLQAGKLEALRYVVFGGEALDFTALKQWQQKYGVQQPQLINMYGITETTVHVTFCPISASDIERGQSNIGRPLADLNVYLLNEHQHLMPYGFKGELCISGPGVTAGYLGQSELTAERFIPNPFVNSLPAELRSQHTHLYRSGDLASYTVAGELLYMGRIDEQVKIRGYRIELAEIESALQQLPGIREAVVVAHESAQLAAYYLAEEGAVEQDGELLKQQLSVFLPQYMLPASYQLLDAWPLTPSGKINKAMLPAADFTQLNRVEYVAAQTPTQIKLAEIWCQVLGLESVGIRDNFFNVGGHSLSATQALALAQEAFSVEVPLREVFENPTIEAIAEMIDKALLEQSVFTETAGDDEEDQDSFIL